MLSKFIEISTQNITHGWNEIQRFRDDELRADAATEEKTVKGYTVKVKYASTSRDEGQAKKDAIAKVLMESMKWNGFYVQNAVVIEQG
jgi:hypothetical protein